VEQRVDGRGVTTVTLWSPSIAVFRTEGFLSDDLARFALDRNRTMLADLVTSAKRVDHASFSGFYDWEQMTGYSPTARADSTGFIVEHRKQFRRAVVLTGSPLVAMAVNVANLVVAGFLEATTSRAEFEARLLKAKQGG
jgi:hypothetical protein